MKGQLFNSLTSELIAQRKHVHDVCRQFAKSPSKGQLKRLLSLFNSVGEAAVIEAGFYCDHGNLISLGNRVFININCTILDAGKVIIGDDCLIGPNVQLLTVNHPVDAAERLLKQQYIQDVTLGNNVWLGASVIVLPGVTIGDNSVIGAGSVVTHSVPNNVIYAGNPARKIK